MKTVEEYLLFLESKGFSFGEDAIGFIYFGKAYTNTTDELVITAIECTLKLQKKFDGSFFVSLLEMFNDNELKTKKEVMSFIKKNHLFPL
ncbi:hypothetical protein KGR20_17240 [Cytobacillus oceanisediminis]|uniref:DUF6123 family protein n=1 Tax=Bacillaceae TaxID=186817 RepID=UPI0003328A26|nr:MULTISPECIES: DUF6123 family protein [Bacillaceae]EOR23531.1 hypothetical protein A499_12311 [Niallia nealsonii AAU1]MBQ6448633.1 hypothetical protein [Bacillus sp. (in: firmicutes)]MDU1844421.1 DUF6123 family protein [Niallia nealsonii]MBZ9535931.1 hypothetical protein [Cytobacillus oceanisediminis]MED3795151.1 DUF6123 family protein [Niallia alba]